MKDEKRIRELPCWSGEITIKPLTGGLTNHNFIVTDSRQSYVVRMADDIPTHGILRYHEQATSEAAYQAGIAPKVIHAQPDMMVMQFIAGTPLDETTIRQTKTMPQVVSLIRKTHLDIPKFLPIPATMFSVHHVNHHYIRVLELGACRLSEKLPEFAKINSQLELDTSPFNPVFGHNDLLAANFIDDGERLWLVDWEYAGYNSPLFDLAGLASNNQLNPEEEAWLLETYFEQPVTPELRSQFAIMKAASLLRESLWSLVQEQNSSLDVDYVAYSDENLQRFEKALSELH